jgi:hypothetical protein
MFARFTNKNEYLGNAIEGDTTSLEKVNSFKALAGIHHAGCELNVLSFFNVISQQFAREQTTCLALTGQTIFNLVAQLSRFGNLEQIGYVWAVVRYPISKLGFIINKLTRKQNTSTDSERMYNHHNTFVVLKFYENDTHNDRESHVGHTIALYFHIRIDNTTTIMMIDPQAQKYIDISTGIDRNTEFKNYMRTININKNFFDVVFREMPSGTVEKWNSPVSKKDIADDGSRLIVYNTERYMGGKKSSLTREEFLLRMKESSIPPQIPGGSIVNKRRKNKQHKRTRKRTNKHKKSKTKKNKQNKRTNKHTKSKKGKGKGKGKSKKSKKLYTNKKTKKL